MFTHPTKDRELFLTAKQGWLKKLWGSACFWCENLIDLEKERFFVPFGILFACILLTEKRLFECLKKIGGPL